MINLRVGTVVSYYFFVVQETMDSFHNKIFEEKV